MEREKIKDEFISMFEAFMFEIVPEKLRKFFGEGALIALMYDIVKDASKKTITRYAPRNVVEAIEYALKLQQTVFGDFEFQIRELGGKVCVEVIKCPHQKYVDGAPYRCVPCIAMIAGAIESTGKRVQVNYFGRKVGAREPHVVIKIEKHKPLGHDRCLLEVLVSEDAGSE
ncbi:hypothetical protein EYM_01410 [Ignicoccus islandicus DSM 13165]|uniref:Metanogen output domain-containing protein n=1 Tax=Ignicoccus islandicus DSM 13165 TaxID=940295 RepID=A0A0U3FRU8_9CREN|nr:methanogen output domain 1-containing protein [Ignicoccus islandicus]ALU12208.1 hypothetical protein EYM_01410 [Ignicoccus islandicus DSM 13165]